SAGSWSATPRCSASPPRCGGPPGSGSSSCPAPTTTRSSCWTTWPAEAAGNNPWTHAERLLTGEQALCRVRSRSALLEREAVGVTGVLGPGADPDRRRRALEVVVVHALPALTGAHVRDDLVQAALGAQRDERGARRVTGRSRDGDGARVAAVVVVVGAALDRALGHLRHLHERVHVLPPRVPTPTSEHDDRIPERVTAKGQEKARNALPVAPRIRKELPFRNHSSRRGGGRHSTSAPPPTVRCSRSTRTDELRTRCPRCTTTTSPAAGPAANTLPSSCTRRIRSRSRTSSTETCSSRSRMRLIPARLMPSTCASRCTCSSRATSRREYRRPLPRVRRGTTRPSRSYCRRVCGCIPASSAALDTVSTGASSSIMCPPVSSRARCPGRSTEYVNRQRRGRAPAPPRRASFRRALGQARAHVLAVALGGERLERLLRLAAQL